MTNSGGKVSIPVTLIVLLLAVIIFTFGSLHARWARQREDYIAIKAGVKPARKSKWSLFWRMVKFGVGLFIAGALMIGWIGHDIRSSDANDSTPVPAKVTAPPSKAVRR